MTEEYLEELIRKYAEDAATEEEVRQLMSWYQTNSIEEVKWYSSNPNEKQEVYHRMLQRLLPGMTTKKGSMLFSPWLKVAAALLIVIGGAFLVWRHTIASTRSYITIVNPSGKIQEVLLPDSSKVWLNAATKLRYLKSFAKQREVELVGEGYFEVRHDLSHPFSIYAGGIQTTVLGTSFDIKAYDSDNKTTVSVISGRVQVTHTSKSLAVLKPSMQLQYNKQDKTAITKTTDSNSVLSWKRGKLQFEGESLADIANSLERWYGIKIVFANTEMKSCRYYMGFDNQTPLAELLSSMAELTKMQYKVDKGIIILSGKGCK